MPNSSFSDINIVALSIAFLAGIWGAVLNFIKRDNFLMTFSKKIAMFVMDLFVNVGLTILTYLGAIGYGMNELLAVAIGGFIGHLGTRSIYLVELIIAEKIGANQTFKVILDEKLTKDASIKVMINKSDKEDA